MTSKAKHQEWRSKAARVILRRRREWVTGVSVLQTMYYDRLVGVFMALVYTAPDGLTAYQIGEIHELAMKRRDRIIRKQMEVQSCSST